MHLYEKRKKKKKRARLVQHLRLLLLPRTVSGLGATEKKPHRKKKDAFSFGISLKISSENSRMIIKKKPSASFSFQRRVLFFFFLEE